MDLTGTAEGNRIILDQALPLPSGTRVRVDVSPLATGERGSPAAVLALAGTLTDAEAKQIADAAAECRRVDARLWNGKR